MTLGAHLDNNANKTVDGLEESSEQNKARLSACKICCPHMSSFNLICSPSIEPFPIIIFNLGLTPIGVFHRSRLSASSSNGTMSGNAFDYLSLAVDLLNQAKSESADKKKRILLEQVREIVLHRDKTLISDIVPEILDMALNMNVQSRVFVVNFVSECFDLEFDSILEPSLACFTFLLSLDHEKIWDSIAQVVLKIYTRVILTLANDFTTAKKPNLKQLMMQMRSLASKVMDKIPNSTNDSFRTQAVHLARVVVLFGLRAPEQKVDPRRRGASGASTESQSVKDISSTSEFASMIPQLEEEAEQTFENFLYWSKNGGPQGSPFTPEQMSVLGQSVCTVGTHRGVHDTNGEEDPRGAKAVEAIIQLLTSKKRSDAKNMSGGSRKRLALALNSFIKSNPPMPKSSKDFTSNDLKKAANDLEELGFEGEAVKVNVAAANNRKRDAKEMTEGGDEDDEKTRKSALEALNAAESAQKKAKSEEQEQALASAKAGSAFHEQTELASDLALLSDAQQSMNIVKMGKNHNLIAISQTTDFVSQMAATTMQRTLESFYQMTGEGPTALKAHTLLCVRVALTMAKLDEESENIGNVKTPIFALLPPNISVSMIEGIPQHVNIPKSVWLLLSFALSPTKEVGTAKNVREKQSNLCNSVREKLCLVVELLNQLHSRAVTENRVRCQELYDDIALLILSRFMQNVNLRELTSPFFVAMPAVPQSCLLLLKLLMFTGTKPAAAIATGVRPGQFRESKNRGTRAESLTTLSHMIFAIDETAGLSALNTLLWCAVSDDFEMRSKAVALVVGEVMQQANWAYEAISLFALQVAAQIVGVENITARAESSQAAREMMWGDKITKKKESEKKKKEAAEKAAAAAAAVADGGNMEVDEEEGDREAEEVTEEEEEEVPVMSLLSALEEYDDGARFGGSFSVQLCLSPEEAITAAGVEKFTKRCMQLLTQICSLDHTLLGCFVDMVGALASASGINDPNAVVDIAKKPEAVAAEGQEEKEVEEFGAEQRYKTIFGVIRKELTNTLPAATLHHSTDAIFESIARADPLGKPLVAYALEVLHEDKHMPATPVCIKKVMGYLCSVNGGDAEALDQEKELEGEEKEASEKQVLDKLSEHDLRFCFPLLAGFNKASVSVVLPSILKMLLATPDAMAAKTALNRVFSRLALAAPPVYTKGELLTFIHRLDPDEHGMDGKSISTLIDICLERRDFDRETIKETLFNLTEDEEPCTNVMRTGILSANKISDVKKFLLSDIIPKMIKKKVWTFPGKTGKYPVWNGVVISIKNYAEQKDASSMAAAEQMLRCVLSLPALQLKQVIKAGQDKGVKETLAKLMKALSTREKDEIVSGRHVWADAPKQIDKDKEKIITDLQNTKI